MIGHLLRIANFKFITLKREPIKKVSKIFAQIESYSVCGRQVLEKQYVLAQDVVNRQVPGDFVECGVYNGGSASAIAMALRHTGKKAWLYDSFAGMPKTTKKDGPLASQYAGLYIGSEEKVREAFNIISFPEDKLIIRKGWFKDTLRDPLPKEVSILHIDCDWYDSVMLTLGTFYDLVAEGGVILLDDFGHWEGCREAFYDFVRKRNISPLLERFGYTQAFWIKGRKHNREFIGKWEIP